MSSDLKNISVLGSTGSIGRNTLKIMARFPERFKVKALTAKKDVAGLARQIIRFEPEVAVVFDASVAAELKARLPQTVSTRILSGSQAYCQAAAWEDVDTVVSAMVGAAGLEPTLAAIEAGKTVALANKETLVMAGDIVMGRAAQKGVPILPVDSEHSAIFQCLQGNRRRDLKKIILTASGGPFVDLAAEAFKTIDVAAALKHPNWRMGPKITIDSATLMNKGLEVIEAMHLFRVGVQEIEVVVHPQSIIHSMVAYHDGSVMAQLGLPDMQTAIAYALSFPERLALAQPVPDFADLGRLTFRKPDLRKFPCLALAFEAGQTGGSLPAVMNAANEVAVSAFLNGDISFTAIAAVIKATMARHTCVREPGLADIMSADQWARHTAAAVIAGLDERAKLRAHAKINSQF